MDNPYLLSPVNDRLKLDNLPDDIYHFYLFKYFDVDIIFKFRLISKKFYAIVRSYGFKELFFIDPNYDHNYDYRYYFFKARDHWLSTTKSVDFRSQFDISKLGILINQSNYSFNLKYLRIQKLRLKLLPIRIEDLNAFKTLEILEFEGLDPCSYGCLMLPKLKALLINFFTTFIKSNKTDSLIIDTPNLHTMSIHHFNRYERAIDNLIKFVHPQSIKHLKISCNDYDKNAVIFSNLQTLEIAECIHEGIEVDDILSFKHLTKLRITKPYEALIKKLEKLFVLKKPELEVVIAGVKTVAANNIYYPLLEFQINSYEDLEDNLNFVRKIDYNDLILAFLFKGRSLPADLFKKYTNIQNLLIDGQVENKNELLSFISACSNLIHLEIRGSLLSQHFFDLLPTITSLNYLCIMEFKLRIKLNFGFIMKMPYLEQFNTDQDMMIDKNLNFRDLKSIKKIAFRIEGREISLSKICDDNRTYYMMELLTNPVITYRNLKFKRLIKLINRLRERINLDFNYELI